MTSFVVVPVLVACSSSSEGSSAPVTDQTLQAIVDAICEKLQSCTSPIFMQAGGGLSRCKERQLAQLRLEARGSGVLITDGQAQSCRAALAAASCADVSAGLDPKECTVPGSLADGAPCASDRQCASGSCFVDDTTTCGTCGRTMAEGGDCTKSKCASGLTCNDAKKCVRRGAEGAACTDDGDAPCGAFLQCIDGRCGRGLGAEADCTVGATETPCDVLATLVCTPPNTSTKRGKCKPLTLASSGEKCGVISSNPLTVAGCVNGSCVDGRCVADLADGSPCSPTDKTVCQSPAECRNGRCALRDPAICK